jgi:Domain of unknown function (DUF427)
VTGGYPPALPPVNHTAPVPRRIRATLAGQTVLDTTSALYVWEWPHYPQYYIPLADIDPAVLVDEQHEQKLSRGTARRYSLQAGDVTRPAALRVYGDDAVIEGLAGRDGLHRREHDRLVHVLMGSPAGRGVAGFETFLELQGLGRPAAEHLRARAHWLVQTRSGRTRQWLGGR